MIYLIVLILLLFLSFRYDINGKTEGRDLCYLTMLVVFILIAGLRWRLGVDTPNYLNSFYHRYPALDHFSFENYPIGKDPFYVLINSIIKSIGGRFYMVQLIQATFVNVLIFKYIKKHSKYIFTCVFFYYLMGYIGYTMEIMRGSMSIVLCLFGNDFILDKKWGKGYLLYVLALCFHAQTIILFLLPALFFLRFNKIGILALIGAFVVGYILQVSIGDYIELLDMDNRIGDKAAKYAESDVYGGQERNLNYMILYIFPKIIYGLFSLIYLKKCVMTSNLLKLEPFLMLGFMFLLMQLNIQIAYRYVDYYIIYFVLFISEFSVEFSRKLNFSKSIALIRTFIILFPFIFSTMSVRMGFRLKRYYPYSSVIERKVDHKREIYYSTSDKPHANRNEF